jgi:serine/threonine protein kinase/Tol biopolymer transport system component
MDGGQLGHFSLVEKIGEGGMGRVFKARDGRLERFVAIKVLADDRMADADRRSRFIQEAKAASALNHPNIITIYEIGEEDGQTFIAMELVDGQPLSELIPRKGMRVTEALRVAVQVADALTAAHAAGIVHRDLKPANIMVDAHGRVRVLDFGLAKLSVPPAQVGAEEATQTIAEVRLVTEDGIILGSIPYMSPEQAEGMAVDARSDIFSFGAVLYEMITGQRAFQGASRISTLAAVVEKDPPPPSEISSGTPPELERLIARCLRKDLNRRSQHMSDVKLALEELRDESESGKLAGPAAADRAGTRRWLWPTVAITSVLVAMGSLAWIFGTSYNPSKGPNLVRLSPEDGHSYYAPALSPDGGFVAYISDRSGKDELWLQQVGGAEPIQLTHSAERVDDPSFFPDGKQILYLTVSTDKKSTIETIATLGGAPKILIQGGQMGDNDPKLSPDGRQIAYVENRNGWHLMTVSSAGGQPRELQAFAATPGVRPSESTWTADSRYLLFTVVKPTQAGSAEWDWFAFPVDGGEPVKTGIGEKLRAAGAGQAFPQVVTPERVLGSAVSNGHRNVWEIPVSPGSWSLKGIPRQLTFGAFDERPSSVSASGTMALMVEKYSSGIYLIPLSPSTGQPTGVAQKLDQDVRPKALYYAGGDPGSIYYYGANRESWGTIDHYALDLNSGAQKPVSAGLSQFANFAISPDGRYIAYSYPDGDGITISVGEVGAGYAQARVLCKGCGRLQWFSPDGRFLFYHPEVKVKPDPKQKLTLRLLEISSGKDRPWAEDPIHSVSVLEPSGSGSEWVALTLRKPGEQAFQDYVVRWREQPIPPSELTKRMLPLGSGQRRFSPAGDVYYVDGNRFMLRRFDRHSGNFGEAHEIGFPAGSAVSLDPSDRFAVRSRGLVFAHAEPAGSSLWLMKLPH